MSNPTVPPIGFREKANVGFREFHNTVKLPFSDIGFSNFEFVARRFGGTNTLRRIFSLARKLGYRSMLEEKINDDHPSKYAEDEALRKSGQGFTHSEMYRLSFFTSLRNVTPTQNEFLGYVVVRTDWYDNKPSWTYVYESVLKPFRTEAQNNFLHCKRKYQVANQYGVFEVEGTLYAQQNGITSICAHVALRSVLSLLLPAGDISYSEINRLAGRQPTDTKGLTARQIKNVINGCSHSKQIQARKLDKNYSYPFSPLLYGYIESGCPALLSFGVKEEEGVGHIVPVLGHTFNEDTWVAEARNGYFDSVDYYSSEGWLSTYLIHDDNFGPYQCIPRGFIDQSRFWNLFGLHYEGAALWSDRAESDALEFIKNYVDKCNKDIKDTCLWFDHFIEFGKAQQLVLRSIFITKTQYLVFLHRWQFEESLINKLRENLPEFFWMVEVSCPELFSATRGKFGEVLLTYEKADENSGGTIKPLAMRLPGIVEFSDSTANRTAIQFYTPLLQN